MLLFSGLLQMLGNMNYYVTDTFNQNDTHSLGESSAGG